MITRATTEDTGDTEDKVGFNLCVVRVLRGGEFPCS